jgi:hypothetical protein
MNGFHTDWQQGGRVQDISEFWDEKDEQANRQTEVEKAVRGGPLIPDLEIPHLPDFAALNVS